MRIDKWLWAARFFKTRSLAAQAVEHGRVRLDDERVKPAKEIRPGNRLQVRIGEYEWDITVLLLSSQRGPATLARGLYEESEASRLQRSEQAAERRMNSDPASAIKGRPTKKARRLIHRFTGDE